MVEFPGIPFDAPEYSEPVSNPDDIGPDYFAFDDSPPKRGTSRSKKAQEDTLVVDAPTAAAMVLMTANGVALQLAGSKAGMTEQQYAQMHTPLTYMIGHSEVGKQTQKYAAPLALIVASFAWLAQVANAYREKHPARPKTVVVTPNKETPGSATVTGAPDMVEPDVSQNGIDAGQLNSIATLMGH